MADENTQNEFSYIGKTPLLRALKNHSGQFFLFSQYAEDLTKFLGNPVSDMPVPSTFYCLKVEKPNPDTHLNETVTDEDPDAPIIIPEPTEDSIYVVYYGNNDNPNNVYWEAAPKDRDYTIKDNFGWTNGEDTFSEWNTTEIGGGDSYSPDDIIRSTNLPSTNIILYAQWIENRNTIEEEREEEELERPVDEDDVKWTSEQIRQWLFVNPSEEGENYPDSESQLTLLQSFESTYCKELKYKGNINIFGRDKVDGINYNEIYCHIDNDAKRQKFELNLSSAVDQKYGKNYVIGYGPNPNPYQFTDYSDLIGEIFQNEYENGNTFFKLNADLFSEEEKWDPNRYSLGRLLYVLYKNEMIHFTPLNTPGASHLWDDEPDIRDYNDDTVINSSNISTSESLDNSPRLSRTAEPIEPVGQAGVLSSKALFDSWYEGTGTEEDPARGEYRYFQTNDMTITDMPEKVKFDFNCIIVCYTHKNMITGETDGVEIPMGIYFTGWDSSLDSPNGDFSNVFTKYVKNFEIYNQGTSYTLRICARTIASQATEQGAERVVEILSATNTGEWVNEYEMLMCKFDETNNALEEARDSYSAMSKNIENSLQLFRNNRTNVPYIAMVNGVKYWFVNGVNTWVKVFEPDDYADWDTDPIEPAFSKVTISAAISDYYSFLPVQEEGYVGVPVSFDLYPAPNYKITMITMVSGENTENWSVEELEYDYADTASDNISRIKRTLIPNSNNYNYTITILDPQYDTEISAETESLQNNE